MFLHLLHWEGKLILRDPLRLSVCERPHNLYHGRQQQSKRLIVQEGNIKHEASEVSVQRDSHTQWHRGESQHAARDWVLQWLARTAKGIRQDFDDTCLQCRLSLPLNRNIFFLLDEMPSHSSQIFSVIVIRWVGCLCYKNVFVIWCRDRTDHWLA